MSAETLTLSNSIMLLQPKYLKLIRNYKPSSQELSSAFYKIIRTSQYNNKPSTKYFRPITLSNALITASLRYEDKKAEELLGVKFLPLVSSQDTNLIRVLFDNAHILPAGPFSLHLNKSATLARMRQGSFGVIISHVRKIIAPLIKNCVRCTRNSKNIETFNPPVGTPRFLTLLESSSPIFLGVSMDAIGPIKLLLECGARGGNATSKGYILIAFCVITKCCTFYMMEDVQRQDIKIVISTHCA